jgi:UDP-N-acetylmuramoyl-tripeptide--D-alanyl-D-alanine ligase
MERLSLRDLMQATGGRLGGTPSPDLPFDRVSIDSRDVRAGDVFWALRGERHDGHDFIPQALERGAALCVTGGSSGETAPGPRLIVADTVAALADVARWYRSTLDALVIGVTGSVGKTTTRDLIHAALASEFDGVRSRKNFNNAIGLPLSLLDIEHQHEFAVLEMGASRQGDIRELAEIAVPEVGVVTAIGPAHLATFGSLDAIVRTKGELLECLPSSGFAVLPGDDPILRQMADRAPCPIIFVGEGDDNHLRATRVEASFEGLRFDAEGCSFDVPICGRHHLTSVLCAIAIAREVGVRSQSIAQGLSHFEPVEGRSRVLTIGSWTVIDDAYNSSPKSMAAACQMLRELELPGIGQRILVLGDMKELGPAAAAEHNQIGSLAARLQIDLLLACGSHADDIAHGAERAGMDPHRIAAAPDIDTLKAVLDCWLEPGDVILIKGSRATRMERMIEWLRDRAALEDALRGIPPQRHCA